METNAWGCLTDPEKQYYYHKKALNLGHERLLIRWIIFAMIDMTLLDHNQCSAKKCCRCVMKERGEWRRQEGGTNIDINISNIGK